MLDNKNDISMCKNMSAFECSMPHTVMFTFSRSTEAFSEVGERRVVAPRFESSRHPTGGVAPSAGESNMARGRSRQV